MAKGWKKQFCIYGHDTFICGKTKNSQCNQCIDERHPGSIGRPKQQFCSRGHDTFICGRDEWSECHLCKIKYRLEHKEEKRSYNEKYRQEHLEELKEYAKIYFQINKQEIKIRRREYHSQYYLDNLAKAKEYYLTHLEEILEYHRKYFQDHKDEIYIKSKEYRDAHPEVHRLSNTKQEIKRKSRIPKFGQRGIKTFYTNKPNGMEIDHYIPLQGDFVSGLHVIWNLQYLTPHANRVKNNNIDLLEASEWYGKLLEQAGLKDKKPKKRGRKR
jgi:hypothetical protein